jgi:hypothetical protein
MSGCKEGDIEIRICYEFDSPDGDDIEDWDEVEDWKTEDYWEHNIPEERYFLVVEKNQNIMRVNPFSNKKIGLYTKVLNSVLIHHSMNDRYLNMYENCMLEHISLYTNVDGKCAEYSHEFHENGVTCSIHRSINEKLNKGTRYMRKFNYNGEPQSMIYYKNMDTIKYFKYKDGVPFELVKNPKIDRRKVFDYDEILFHFGKENARDDFQYHLCSYFPNTDNSSSVGMSDDDDSSSSWGSAESPAFSL